MKRGIAALLVLLVMGLVAWADNEPVRTWKSRSGKYEMRGAFVEFKNGRVVLRRENGKLLRLSMQQLSTADQQFVRDELKRRRAGVKESEDAAGGLAVSAIKERKSNGEWPEWRGPRRDGISDEKGLLTSWPDDGPKLAWRTSGLGGGYSSISIADGKIFTMGSRNGGVDLIARDVDNGAELWSLTVRDGGSAPNCTPTYSDGQVFAVGHKGDLVCADAKTGKELWRKNYANDFGGKMMSGWGYSESPLVDGDRLICTPGSAQAMMAALNKRTGDVIWQTPMPQAGGAGYSSIVISNGGGVKQYVQLVGKGVIGVEAKSGKLLWGYQRIANTTANVPTPLIKDDYVFCSSGYGDGGSALLKLESAGRGVTPREVYYLPSNKTQNHHGGMILLGDHVYMGHGHNNGFPLCMDLKTGRDVWRPGRGPGSGSAAVVYADGHLYFRYENGVMALIEASPKDYNLKSSFRIASRNGKSWPHPVIAGGLLYLRDQDELLCYDIRKQF